MTDDEKKAVRTDFRHAVNMSAAEIGRWLETEDSKRVGWKGEDGRGSGESVGHRSGRRIIDIERTKQSDLSEADYAHMKKVVGYVRRHCAQGPAQDIAHSDWRYSLMNWGHDPLKD